VIGAGSAAQPKNPDPPRETSRNPVETENIMGQLNDKVALVTGGTSGIGLAAAQRLAAEGAHVFITGRDKQRLDEALASIGASATGIRGDVTDPDDLDRVADAVKDTDMALTSCSPMPVGESWRRWPI
jgi:nucleoside-diphosphate-sugar epimerase